MSHHNEVFKQQQAENAAAREKQIAENHRIMEEQAKLRPVPSLEEIQAAAYKGRPEGKPEASPPDVDMSPPLLGKGAPKEEEPAVVDKLDVSTKSEPVEKASTAEHQSGGTYKTRDARPKR